VSFACNLNCEINEHVTRSLNIVTRVQSTQLLAVKRGSISSSDAAGCLLVSSVAPLRPTSNLEVLICGVMYPRRDEAHLSS